MNLALLLNAKRRIKSLSKIGHCFSLANQIEWSSDAQIHVQTTDGSVSIAPTVHMLTVTYSTTKNGHQQFVV